MYALSMVRTTLKVTAEELADIALPHTVVACEGAVLGLYPGYRAKCQHCVDELVSSDTGVGISKIGLVMATESSLVGAAVAAACHADKLAQNTHT